MLMGLPELLFLLVIFVANTFEAMTGFAGTLLAMPASIMLIGVDEAKTVLNVIALICCSWIAVRYRAHINKKEFMKIAGFMLFGMVVGILLYDFVAISYLLKVYAVIIILIALKNIFIKKIITFPSIGMIVIILVAGIIHGMFLSGGSFLVIYAIFALKDKAEFRATLASVWVVLDSIMLFNQIRLGHLNNETIPLILLSIIPLVFAIAIGNRLHERINQKSFLKLTYILLLISGISLIIK
ncbi:sulfite exporter TauE/SafE family protein [Lederbergia citrisecunda]|uniref:TSUP family transporter n=1 Tax=Lederbergia citrisecunda TaxID=2833583 RepID=UPI003D2A277E